MQRRHHYEQAFEAYLRANRIPYVAVDEARKALLPESARLRVTESVEDQPEGRALKSFDLVVYAPSAVAGKAGDDEISNLLIDIKGRKIPLRKRKDPLATGRLENWVTEDDIASLEAWESLFGEGFRAAFVFVYWCEAQPPDGLFQEVFENRGRWYAVRAVALDEYVRCMKTRSPRWRTVHLSAEDFQRVSQPFAGVGTV